MDALRTRPLRRAVLRPDWPADAAIHGDGDPRAVHLAAFEGDDLVAACLLLPKPYPPRPGEPGAWQLRGMATGEQVRGRGVGSGLLDAALQAVRDRAGQLVWCEARTSAAGFYTRNGFTVDGPEYPHAETGAPHHLMWRRI